MKDTTGTRHRADKDHSPSWWRGKVGRRGSVLIFFALIDTDIGWSLLFNGTAESRPPWTVGADRLFSPVLWALLWFAVAVVCLVQAFRHSDRLGYAAAVLIKMLWGLLYIGAVVVHHLPSAIVPGVFWLSMAGWVIVLSRWSEPHQEPGDG